MRKMLMVSASLAALVAAIIPSEVMSEEKPFDLERSGKVCLSYSLNDLPKNIKIISVKLPTTQDLGIQPSASTKNLRKLAGEIDVLLGGDSGIKATYEYVCVVNVAALAAKPEYYIGLIR